MGIKSDRTRFCAALILIVAVVFLAACNRSATKATATPGPTESRAAGQTPQTTTNAPQPQSTAAEVGQPTTESAPTTEQTQPQPAATQAATDQPQPTATTPLTAEQTYLVAVDDTLFGIANRYGVTVEELAARNNIVDVHQLDVGQQLIIPVPGAAPSTEAPATGERVHLVQAGENLFRISLQYNLSFESVAAYNNIPWPFVIYPGQEIRIPPTG